MLIAAAVAVVVVGAAVMVARNRDGAPQPAPSASTSSLLVLTWAPSLCRVETSASGCRSGAVTRRGQSLLLHGLWPQPRDRQYCGVPKQTRDRRQVDLPGDLQTRLRALMSDSTVLAPHEWYAHGTCSGVGATEYFTTATALAEQAIAVLDPVFDRAAGRELSSRAVRDAVGARLGSAAADRVALSCRPGGDGRAVVFEVRLSLPAVSALDPAGSLADALAAGPPVGPGCGRAALP